MIPTQPSNFMEALFEIEETKDPSEGDECDLGI